MVHPLVEQLRFARAEFRRGLVGVTEEDAQAHLGPSNCISWSIGHPAWQEERYFVKFGQGETVVPRLPSRFGYGSPPSTPTLAEAWAIWEQVTAVADRWLDTLTPADLVIPAPHDVPLLVPRRREPGVSAAAWAREAADLRRRPRWQDARSPGLIQLGR